VLRGVADIVWKVLAHLALASLLGREREVPRAY
jgi:hypothetical protein